MFIRVTTGTFDPSREAEVQRWLEDQFRPAVRHLPGLLSYHAGFDRASGRFIGVTRWETQEQAEALRERAAALVSQLSAIGVQAEPSHVFEETVTG